MAEDDVAPVDTNAAHPRPGNYQQRVRSGSSGRIRSIQNVEQDNIVDTAKVHSRVRTRNHTCSILASCSRRTDCNVLFERIPIPWLLV